jgi:hypothetical protein
MRANAAFELRWSSKQVLAPAVRELGVVRFLLGADSQIHAVRP